MSSRIIISSTKDKISVTLRDTGNTVECKLNRDSFEVDKCYYRLFDFINIIQVIGARLCTGYVPVGKLKKAPVFISNRWLTNKITRQIARPITAELKKLHQNVDPTILSLDRMIHRCFGNKYLYPNVKDIYNIKDAKFVKDLCTYNAAMIAAVLQNKTSNFDWIRYYSYNGKAYPGLAKTLKSINYPIPRQVMSCLQRMKLDRPRLTRWELLAWYYTVDSFDAKYDKSDILPIWLNASADEIRDAHRKLYGIYHLQRLDGVKAICILYYALKSSTLSTNLSSDSSLSDVADAFINEKIKNRLDFVKQTEQTSLPNISIDKFRNAKIKLTPLEDIESVLALKSDIHTQVEQALHQRYIRDFVKIHYDNKDYLLTVKKMLDNSTYVGHIYGKPPREVVTLVKNVLDKKKITKYITTGKERYPF